MIDYRGFGDSTGTPSEEGLVEDGLAAWNWLLSNGARQEDISIFGSSLGTAVGSHLTHKLAELCELSRSLGLGVNYNNTNRSETPCIGAGFAIHFNNQALRDI